MLPCTYFVHTFVGGDHLLFQTIWSWRADVLKSSEKTETMPIVFTDKIYYKE